MMVTQDRFVQLVPAVQPLLSDCSQRSFLAIAGAPGSGKSTVAEALCDKLLETHPDAVAILPMDGFHFDDAILHQMGRRPWKGAPDTFDVGGFHALLKRLSDPTEGDVAVPVFDRDLEISRGCARIISRNVRLIIVEGNYLLLDREPWDKLAACFDLTMMIDVRQEVLRQRLRQRWVGFGLTEDEILHKLDDNDLPNGRDVIENSRKADIIYLQE